MSEGRLCAYGCRRPAAHYFKSVDKWCCNKNVSLCPEVIDKIRRKATGRKHTQKTKDKISKINKERPIPEGCMRALRKIHKEQIGKPSGMKGKERSKEAIRITSKKNKGKKRTPQQIENLKKGNKKAIEKKEGKRFSYDHSPLKGKKLSKDHRYKLSIAKKGKPSPKKGIPGPKASSETKRKMRITHIKILQERIANGGQITPAYNSAACILIDEYGEQNNFKFQHAMNGGEFHIKELGYWVDGYDPEKNVVVEVDEPHHFNADGNLCKRDVRRQSEITEYLERKHKKSCVFIRLRI